MATSEYAKFESEIAYLNAKEKPPCDSFCGACPSGQARREWAAYELIRRSAATGRTGCPQRLSGRAANPPTALDVADRQWWASDSQLPTRLPPKTQFVLLAWREPPVTTAAGRSGRTKATTTRRDAPPNNPLDNACEQHPDPTWVCLLRADYQMRRIA